MSSEMPLDQFLADLDTRRERLLQFARPESSSTADLLVELTELSQQLIVADEELRVQQEELERTRHALTAMVNRRDLLGESHRPAAVTDSRGVVLMATPAVQNLLRQPPARLTPRPIATWFEVADRPQVRRMIGRIAVVGDHFDAERLTMRAGNGEHVVVDLSVEGVADPDDGTLLLRWEVSVSPPVRLHVLADASAPPVASAAGALTDELAVRVTAWHRASDTGQVLRAVVDAVVDLIPGVGQAGSVLRGPRATLTPGASTGELAAAADRAQVRTEGSAVRTAIETGELVRGDAAMVADWARWQAADRTISDVVIVPLRIDTHSLGALTAYATDGELDGRAEETLMVIAQHAAVALSHTTEIASLHEAVASRQVIGEAVGLLVERHRCTRETAFAMLVERSQRINVKLRHIAQQVVETGQEPSEITGP